MQDFFEWISPWFAAVDWPSLWTPTTPLAEIIVRGSVVYLSLFILLRLILKRQAGSVGMTDLLVIVLIADAAQNALADNYSSLPDGIILVSTLIFWNYALEWLGFRFKRFGRFIHPAPLALIENGRMLHRNMKKELITKEDLMTKLREEGVEDIAAVKRACMEGNGKISIVRKE